MILTRIDAQQAIQETLGPCAKCGVPAILASPSGKYVYCETCGRCGRRVSTSKSVNIRGNVEQVTWTVRECKTSVEQFVWHAELGIWCCPCILAFEQEIDKKGTKKCLN